MIVATAPILALIIANIPLILPNILMGIILMIPTLLLGWLDVLFKPDDSMSEIGGGIVKGMWSSMPWIAPRSFSIISTCYPSIFFITALGISVAVFAASGIFWAYKKIKYNNWVKNLKSQSEAYLYQKLLDNNIEQKPNPFDQYNKGNAEHIPAFIEKDNLQK